MEYTEKIRCEVCGNWFNSTCPKDKVCSEVCFKKLPSIISYDEQLFDE